MKGKTDNIHPDLLELVYQLEKALGYELTITSGKRSPDENEKAGGVKGSEHTYSMAEAVDIGCHSGSARFAIVQKALAMGVVRIGIGKTFIHLGIGKDKPQSVMWHYYP